MEIDELDKAAPLLKELSSDWPDAHVHSQGCIKLAELHISLGEPEQALPLLDRVLQQQNEADFVAMALHHRLQADLLLENLDRAMVTAMRLLTLYPEQQPLYRESLSHLLAATSQENLSAQTTRLKDSFLNLINEKMLNNSEA
jgi:tetratricopeptide (TPR) repeat protein